MLRSGEQNATAPAPIVLVLEDSEDDFYLLHRAFKKVNACAEMLHLRDGASVLDYLTQAKHKRQAFPALLLLDLKLPGMSGFDVLTWIRKDAIFKLLPVNVLSSSAELADVQKAFELGANAFTVKPMGLDHYEELVVTLLKFWFDFGQRPRLR